MQLALAGRVPPGVEVAGVDLGGQDDGARPSGRSDERLAGPVETVTPADRRRALWPSRLARSGHRRRHAGHRASARARHGRHDLPFGLSVYLPLGGGDLEPVVRVDADTYEQGLERVRDKVDVAATDATLSLEGGEVSVVPGADGREVDAVALERLILAAIDAGEAYAGAVPTKAVPPKVSTAEAERARRRRRDLPLAAGHAAPARDVASSCRRRSSPACSA